MSDLIDNLETSLSTAPVDAVATFALNCGDLSEAVSPNHCDKVADRIGDAVLDRLLAIDRFVRTGIEVTLTDREVLVGGEVRTKVVSDAQIAEIAVQEVQRLMLDVGLKDVEIRTKVRVQDPVLSSAAHRGSGDQAVCVGFATDSDPTLLPPVHASARRLCLAIYEASRQCLDLGSDGKLIMFAEADGCMSASIRWALRDTSRRGLDVISDVCGSQRIKVLGINAGAPFTLGRPFTYDTGVLGRKLVVDHYGPFIPIAGGAISGKDASKVDRSGNYMARYAACEISRHFGGDTLVTLCYTTGRNEPLRASFRNVDPRGVRRIGQLKSLLFSVEAIAERFALSEPGGRFSYEDLSKFGHFGRGLPWE